MTRISRVASVVVAVWVVAACLMPVVQDEAYYFAWATHLDWGYFDHPPLVALISWPATFAHGEVWLARIGTVAIAVLTMLAAVRLFRIVGLRSQTALATATVLAFGNLMGLVFGFIATPDTGLMLAWVLALSEAALALRGDHKRWLTAGLATGLGLWAKYIMMLMGPVFLWALIADGKRAGGRGLRTPWPYLGGVAALLVILPHLVWNANHDWITIRFQLHHGLAKEHLAVTEGPDLPRAQLAFAGSHEWQLGQEWASLRDEEEKKERAPRPYDDALKSLNRYFGYYGSQVGAWGALLVAMGLALRDHRRGKRLNLTPSPPMLEAATKPLLVAAAAVPLLVFGTFSLGTQVEANWSAMYIFGAAALLTPALVAKQKSLLWGFAVNAALLGLVLAHAVTGLLPTRPHRDRILAETHGYRDLSAALSKLTGPIFADSYQITAMVNFYSPAIHARQWPGITRDSEFVRRPEMNDLSTAALRRDGGFWLVSTALPPVIAGFAANAMTQLRDCKDSELQVISTSAARETTWRCKKPIHEWYLVRYETTPSSE